MMEMTGVVRSSSCPGRSSVRRKRPRPVVGRKVRDKPARVRAPSPADRQNVTASLMEWTHEESREDTAKRQALNMRRTYLCEHVDIAHTLLWDKLLELEAISAIQVSSIQGNYPDPVHQVSQLLLHIERNIGERFDKFVTALRATGQQYVADQLTGCCMPNESTVRRLREEMAMHIKRHRALSQHSPNIFVSTTCYPVKNADVTHPPFVDAMKVFDQVVNKRTLLEGSFSTGKTTLLNWGATQWASGVLHNALPKELIKVSNNERKDQPLKSATWTMPLAELAFVIPIDLQNIQTKMSLAEVIRQSFQMSLPNDANQLLQFVSQNQDKVAFLFDDLDRYDFNLCNDVTDLIKGDRFPRCTVLTTTNPRSRTSVVHDLTCGYDSHFIIAGLSDAQICEYAKRYFKLRPEGCAVDQDLIRTIHNHKLHELCRIPLHLNLVCSLWGGLKGPSQTKTAWFLEILRSSFSKYCRKYRQSDDVVPNQEKTQHLFLQEIQKLGSKALELLLADAVALSVALSDESNIALDLGWVLREEFGFTDIDRVSFRCTPLKEMLAAHFAANNREGFIKLKQQLTKLDKVHDARGTIQFLCGLSETLGNDLLKSVIQTAKKSRQTAEECPDFHPAFWKSGSPVPNSLASYEIADDLSAFLVQCIREYKNPQKVDIPLPQVLSVDIDSSDLAVFERVAKLNTAGYSAVRKLSFNGTHLSNRIWWKLTSAMDLSKLNSLTLNVKTLPETDHMQAQMSKMTNLSNLELSANIDGHTLSALLKATDVLNNLKFLNLKRVDSSIGAIEMSSALSSAPHLTSLSLFDIDLSILGQSLCAMFNQCLLLEWLNLVNVNLNIKQSQVLMKVLKHSCQNLVHLNLSENPKLDSCMDKIAEEMCKLPKLQILYLTKCALSSGSLKKLFQKLNSAPSLRFVNVSGNSLDEKAAALVSNQAPFKHLWFLIIRDGHMPSTTVDKIKDNTKNWTNIAVVVDEETQQLHREKITDFLKSRRRYVL